MQYFTLHGITNDLFTMKTVVLDHSSRRSKMYGIYDFGTIFFLFLWCGRSHGLFTIQTVDLDHTCQRSKMYGIYILLMLSFCDPDDMISSPCRQLGWKHSWSRKKLIEFKNTASEKSNEIEFMLGHSDLSF